jgi:phage terminase large subunit-like protein
MVAKNKLETYIEQVLSHERFIDPNPLDYFLFNYFHYSECRERAIVGANRIAKSETGGWEAATRFAGFDPLCPWRELDIPSKGWIITDGENVPTIIEKLELCIPPGIIKKFNRAEGQWYIESTMGSKIWIKTHDQERRKFQGEKLHYLWWDEEPRQGIYNECRMRLVDLMGAMWWTLSPIDGSTWLHEHFRNMDPALHNAQLGRFMYCTAGLMDNPYIPYEARVQEAEELKHDLKGREDEYKIRVLGEYIVLGGNPLFKADDLEWMYQPRKPAMVGDIRRTESSYGIEVYPLSEGWLTIWEQPRPGNEYSLGVDVAMDLDQDFSCVWILNRSTQEQAGIWHGHIEPFALGEKAALLGRYFNVAVVNPEVNPPGNSVLEALRRDHYPRIAKRYAAKGEIQDMKRAFGAWTHETTKPLWVHALQSAIGNHQVILRCKETLDELRRFRRISKDNREARPGHYGYGAITGHDDRVMALIHAWQAHLHSPVAFKTRPAPERPPMEERLVKHLKDARVGGYKIANVEQFLGV